MLSEDYIITLSTIYEVKWKCSKANIGSFIWDIQQTDQLRRAAFSDRKTEDERTPQKRPLRSRHSDRTPFKVKHL